MRSARSSVDEAPSKSPWASRVLAWVTSERVAGERLFSRGGNGECCDGIDAGGVGRFEPAAGGAVGGGPDVGAPGSVGRGENSEQPDSSVVIARACSRFSVEAVCAEAWVSRVSE